MKSIITLAASALLTGALASHARADTVWHFPYKAAPYATMTVTNGSAAGLSAQKVTHKQMSHLHGK